MNFIFDIGNVLLDFKPIPFLEGLFESASSTTHKPTSISEPRRFPCSSSQSDIIHKMNEIIFQSEEWGKLDQGIMMHEEAYEIFCKRAPEYQSEIQYTMENLPQMLTPIEATIAILPKVKEAGHDLYYLSNFHAQLRDYILETYSFFEFFDGGVFSCDIHVNKPDARIYQHLLEKYQLSAAECVFFDDMEENVIGANKEGIRGVLFTGVECVKPLIS